MDNIEHARMMKAKRFVDIIKESSPHASPEARLTWAMNADANSIGRVAQVDNLTRHGGKSTHPLHNPSQETWEQVIHLLEADVKVHAMLQDTDPFKGLPR